MDPLHNNRNAGNVIGGHKANISNPHTSEEAKERSRQILEQIGDETQSSKASSNAQGEPSMEGKNKGTFQIHSVHKTFYFSPYRPLHCCTRDPDAGGDPAAAPFHRTQVRRWEWGK